MKDKIHLGNCQKPHGIKGGFKIKLFNQEGEPFSKGDTLWLKPLNKSSEIPDSGRSYVVDSVAYGNHTLVYLKGITSRNEGERIIPFDVYGDKNTANLDEGEFYLEDLPGLSVVDKDSVPLGHIDSFYDNGMQTVLVLKLKLNNELLELPFIDEFFGDINWEKKEIILHPYEVIEA